MPGIVGGVVEGLDMRRSRPRTGSPGPAPRQQRLHRAPVRAVAPVARSAVEDDSDNIGGSPFAVPTRPEGRREPHAGRKLSGRAAMPERRPPHRRAPRPAFGHVTAAGLLARRVAAAWPCLPTMPSVALPGRSLTAHSWGQPRIRPDRVTPRSLLLPCETPSSHHALVACDAGQSRASRSAAQFASTSSRQAGRAGGDAALAEEAVVARRNRWPSHPPPRPGSARPGSPRMSRTG